MTLLLPSVSILADMYINTLARSRDVRSVLIREGMINRGKKRDFLARNVASRELECLSYRLLGARLVALIIDVISFTLM